MIQAIIDIGSNSIRLAIYKIDESKEIKLLMNKKEIARLAAYVVNGIMTTEGIDKACYILSEFKNLLDNLQINNVISFATAAIRNARNSDEVVRCIENNTGLKIIVLSGKEEAGLGFLGAIKDIKNEHGVMVDIGGGSTEIVVYNNCEIKYAFSLPIGALNLTKMYVKGILPNKEECIAIENVVLNVIKSNKIVIGILTCFLINFGIGVISLIMFFMSVFEWSKIENYPGNGIEIVDIVLKIYIKYGIIYMIFLILLNIGTSFFINHIHSKKLDLE